MSVVLTSWKILPPRPVRVRKLLVPVLAPIHTHPVHSLPLDQHWTSRGGRRGRRQRQLFQNLYPDTRKETKSAETESPLARRRSQVHADLLGSPSADTMLEWLAVSTRTRMRYTHSREKLFSLLDVTEDTVMRLSDVTLDHTVCETVHSAVLGRRAVRLWRAHDVGILRRLLAIQPDGSSEVAAYPTGP